MSYDDDRPYLTSLEPDQDDSCLEDGDDNDKNDDDDHHILTHNHKGLPGTAPTSSPTLCALTSPSLYRSLHLDTKKPVVHSPSHRTCTPPCNATAAPPLFRLLRSCPCLWTSSPCPDLSLATCKPHFPRLGLGNALRLTQPLRPLPNTSWIVVHIFASPSTESALSLLPPNTPSTKAWAHLPSPRCSLEYKV